MKDKIVINIGYSNAGTSSLNKALTLLGYSSIHDGWDIYSEDNALELHERLVPFMTIYLIIEIYLMDLYPDTMRSQPHQLQIQVF